MSAMSTTALAIPEGEEHDELASPPFTQAHAPKGAWVVVRPGDDGRARFFLRMLRGPTGRTPSSPPPCTEPLGLLQPQVLQPGTLSFRQWLSRYDYFTRCMFAMAKHRFEASQGLLVWDWAGLQQRLERFVYRTSSSRYRSFAVVK